MAESEKLVAWIGSNRRDLLSFPMGDLAALVRHNAKLVGARADLFHTFEVSGCATILHEPKLEPDFATGCSRVFFVAKFAEAVYVLHAFQKKTQTTSKHDIGVGQVRYKEMLRDRRQLTR